MYDYLSVGQGGAPTPVCKTYVKSPGASLRRPTVQTGPYSQHFPMLPALSPCTQVPFLIKVCKLRAFLRRRRYYLGKMARPLLLSSLLRQKACCLPTLLLAVSAALLVSPLLMRPAMASKMRVLRGSSGLGAASAASEVAADASATTIDTASTAVQQVVGSKHRQLQQTSSCKWLQIVTPQQDRCLALFDSSNGKQPYTWPCDMSDVRQHWFWWVPGQLGGCGPGRAWVVGHCIYCTGTTWGMSIGVGRSGRWGRGGEQEGASWSEAR